MGPVRWLRTAFFFLIALNYNFLLASKFNLILVRAMRTVRDSFIFTLIGLNCECWRVRHLQGKKRMIFRVTMNPPIRAPCLRIHMRFENTKMFRSQRLDACALHANRRLCV